MAGPLPNQNNRGWWNLDAQSWIEGLLEIVSSLLEAGLDLLL